MGEFPLGEVIIGAFAFFGAIIAGIFSVYTAKIGKKLNAVEKKKVSTDKLSMGNELLGEIVPALERKDEALDKIAEVLDNILIAQELTNQQLKSMNIILANRCQALALIKAMKAIVESRRTENKLTDIEKDLLEREESILEEVVNVMNGTPKGGDD